MLNFKQQRHAVIEYEQNNKDSYSEETEAITKWQNENQHTRSTVATHDTYKSKKQYKHEEQKIEKISKKSYPKTNCTTEERKRVSVNIVTNRPQYIEKHINCKCNHNTNQTRTRHFKTIFENPSSSHSLQQSSRIICHTSHTKQTKKEMNVSKTEIKDTLNLTNKINKMKSNKCLHNESCSTSSHSRDSYNEVVETMHCSNTSRNMNSSTVEHMNKDSYLKKHTETRDIKIRKSNSRREIEGISSSEHYEHKGNYKESYTSEKHSKQRLKNSSKSCLKDETHKNCKCKFYGNSSRNQNSAPLHASKGKHNAKTVGMLL